MKKSVLGLLLLASSGVMAGNTGYVAPETKQGSLDNVADEPIEEMEYNQGGLLADVYVMSMSKGEFAKPGPDSDFSMGQFFDKKAGFFDFRSTLDHKQLNKYLKTDVVGVEWNGFIKINKTSKYLFSSEISFTSSNGYESGSSNANSCELHYYFDGSRAFGHSLKGKKNDGFFGWEDTQQKVVRLKEGMRPFRVWLNCGADSNGSGLLRAKRISAVLKMRGSGDPVVKPVTASQLYWQ